MSDKVLIVGGGGREHALALALAASPSRPQLLVAPGNPGTAQIARNVPLDAGDPDELIEICAREDVTCVVVGPEDPLIAGLADRLRGAGRAVFGPGAAGARIEGDKAWAKDVMSAAGVPTAAWATFAARDAALAHLARARFPLVVKAIGAAQGKGVAVCAGRAAAVAHLDACLVEKRFGAAGERVLIEECLQGPELSVLAVTDGRTYALLAPSRDHKRIGDGDTGPNTGGMGAFAPVPFDDPELPRAIARGVIEPVLNELRRRRIDYRGVLYAGLMLTADGPRVLEFNCRFGDPETQVVLPLLRGDFLQLVLAVATGRLDRHLAALPAAGAAAPAAWPGAELTDWTRSCVCVVAAAPGYPGAYRRGLPVRLPRLHGPDAWIVHAGTTARGEEVVTAGGRVLGAVGLAGDVAAARARAYALLDEGAGEGLQWRRDIARAAGSGKGGA